MGDDRYPVKALRDYMRETGKQGWSTLVLLSLRVDTPKASVQSYNQHGLPARHAAAWCNRLDIDPAEVWDDWTPPPPPPDLDRSWMADALCREYPPELFFPSVGQVQLAERARKVCDRCPVQAECLAYALATNEKHGIWGGLSENERRRRRQAMRAAS